MCYFDVISDNMRINDVDELIEHVFMNGIEVYKCMKMFREKQKMIHKMRTVVVKNLVHFSNRLLR